MKTFAENTQTIKIQPTISIETNEAIEAHGAYQRKNRLVIAKEWLTLLELIPCADLMNIQGQILAAYTKTAFEIRPRKE